MSPIDGSEVLYVVPVAANGALAASTQQTTTGDIAALAADTVLPPLKNTAISTVGAGTLTAAALVGGVITRSGSTAAFSDATDTAIAIVAALAAYVANESQLVYIRNTTSFDQTITAGAGVTLSGTMVVPGQSVGVYLMTITSATAVTLLRVGVQILTNVTGDIVLGNGNAIGTDTTDAHTAILQAYDVDGTAYKTFATLTNGNTPSLSIAAPAGGTVAVDGATIGGVTPAAGAFTTVAASDNVTMGTAAKGLVLKRGANGKCGTFVCNGVTPVTVNNTSIAVTDTIIISLNTVGGSVGAVPAIQTITASTGFTVAGTAADTSTYNYAIISNAA